MLAGTAAADITPTRSHLLQGHGRGTLSKSVLFPLGARAAVFREGGVTLAIIALDVIGVSLDFTRRVRAEIQKATSIPADHVLICASHTHCAPGTLAALGIIPDGDWMQRVAEASVHCVTEAAGHLEPVTLGLGCGAASFNINRRPLAGGTGMMLNYGGVVDRRARVLRVQRGDGTTLTTLFHYSCHPTSKAGTEALVSPDYPGVARDAIESELGGTALFVPGCFGNIRPNITGANGGFASATKEQLEACGRELAQAVCRASRWVQPREMNELWCRAAGVKLAFGPGKDRKEVEAAARGSDDDAMKPWAKQTLALMEKNAMPAHLDSQVQLLRIGPIVIYAIGGEPVQEIGHAVEKALAPMLNADDVWSVGYSNDMVGYLVTERQRVEGGYEPSAYVWFDQPMPFHEEEATLVAAAVKLASTPSPSGRGPG
ncbi:MAG: neutral/alkaline non-lysosomal ceramidase N-terminal domain-containing protein [Planctomycetes bacterium]|nr:neutral/alkaline non-lysosomal ceramidase N-terminal domain-containing protein [Planctomycetota bacterium]